METDGYNKKKPENEKRNSVSFLICGMETRIKEISSDVGGKKQLAHKAGISESQLYRIMKGDSQPTIGPLVAMAEAANVNLDWIATGRGPKYIGDNHQVAETEKTLNKEATAHQLSENEQIFIKELDNKLIDMDLTIDDTFRDIETEFSEVPGLKSALSIAYKFLKREVKSMERLMDKIKP